MKSFIYTTSEREHKSLGVWHCEKSVRVYRIINGKPVPVGKASAYHVDHAQLVMKVLVENKLIPKRKIPNPYYEGRFNWSYDLMPHQLEDEGIARVTGV